jgi:hypothetical protein
MNSRLPPLQFLRVKPCVLSRESFSFNNSSARGLLQRLPLANSDEGPKREHREEIEKEKHREQ